MCHPVAESALAFRVTVLLGVGGGTPGCQPGLTGRVLGVCVAVRGKTALGPERSLVLSLAWCTPSIPGTHFPSCAGCFGGICNLSVAF